MSDNKNARGRPRPAFETDFEPEQNPLTLSYYNPAWLSYLNASTVLDYFTDKFNPFYEHTCNNEMIRMRGMTFKNTEELYQQLRKMVGIEYIHVHTFEPILHIVRKQRRISPTQEIPLANYYIIAGVIYQAPDLMSIVQTRLTTSIHYLQSAFDQVFSHARFHPSADYYWDFTADGTGPLQIKEEKDSSIKEEPKEESGKSKSKAEKKETGNLVESYDIAQQMYRVDVLIRELVKKFPPPAIKPPELGAIADDQSKTPTTSEKEANGSASTTNGSLKIKADPDDDVMPPPTKKAKLA